MFLYFFKREIEAKYNSRWSAVFWILVQPLLTLAIYYLVFGVIFEPRIPNLQENQFIAYLAVGLWPWFAFSESINAAVDVLIGKKDLISKVKVNLSLVVLASTCVHFLLHGIGFVLVVLALIGFGILPAGWHLWLLLLPFGLLFMFALALAFVFSILQIFIKDFRHFLLSFVTIWFFLTPIIYSVDAIPEQMVFYLQFNPLYHLITMAHEIAFQTVSLKLLTVLGLLLSVALLLYLAQAFFRRVVLYIDEYL